MKKNPVYQRLLRIEITLIAFLIVSLFSVKSCFGPRERDVLPQPPQEVELPASTPLPEAEPSERHNELEAGGTGISPEPDPQNGFSILEENVGLASYYQDAFHGNPTASGERYDPTQYTAAHRNLPFGARVRVTNIATGKQVTVRINDRGPHKRERIIDLSGQAARAIGLIEAGIAQVKLEVLR